MGHSIGVAHDPSAPAGHLPGFAREEIQKGGSMTHHALVVARRAQSGPDGIGRPVNAFASQHRVLQAVERARPGECLGGLRVVGQGEDVNGTLPKQVDRDVPDWHDVKEARDAAMLPFNQFAQLVGCGDQALHSAGCSALHVHSAIRQDRNARNRSPTTPSLGQVANLPGGSAADLRLRLWRFGFRHRSRLGLCRRRRWLGQRRNLRRRWLEPGSVRDRRSPAPHSCWRSGLVGRRDGGRLCFGGDLQFRSRGRRENGGTRCAGKDKESQSQSHMFH
jgi:hypothetical protein